MSRSTERIPKRWNISEIPRRNESSNTEESSSLTDSTPYSPYLQNTSTPLKTRRTNLEEIKKSRRGQEKFEDIEKASSNKKRLERFQKHRKHISRRKQDNERVIEKQKEEHNRRDKRKHEYSEDFGEKKQNKTDSDSESDSDKNYSESDLEKSKRKKHDFTGDNELPITEILRRSQENTQNKYEEQASFPVLNTDKVYVQYKGGFTTMKMNPSKDLSMNSSKNKKIEKDAVDPIDNRSSPPIKIAISIQQFWKRAGLLCQGILAGTALMHFITLCTVFSNSMEFIVKYSKYSEIYTNNFSFLIALCIVATFDKFDLARFDIEHLRELYFDYNKAIIAVPLYLTIFCLHQICAEIDNKLSSIHYYNSNISILQNITNIQSLLDELNNWQKISISKDVLAMFAWLFVALGTRDDSFLIYLQSMKKYINDIETSG
ncbi:uncharacterized protein LOC102681743 isoform X2 [Apis dorsata]|uniref:uncharacterized protein LOC102681743 isoform X2 n=1 Tax=Apis dorsata TaxID=7462 RepID=UPI0003DF7E8B|nr:uncharacterized protein LOC102681743 isoform X2 [Apis dorsata]